MQNRLLQVIIFSLYFKWLAQSRCQYKELRIKFQKLIILLFVQHSKQYFQYLWPTRVETVNSQKHNFQKCMNPVYSCSLEIEDTSHYLLHCHHFALHCIDLMNNVKSICDNFESMIGNNKITLLLYGDSRFDENKNKFLLQSFIKHIKKLNDSPDPFQINFIYFPTL